LAETFDGLDALLIAIERPEVGEVGFDEAVDIVEGVFDLFGECAGQRAITAAAEIAGGGDPWQSSFSRAPLG
jgi:hypothetical protein